MPVLCSIGSTDPTGAAGLFLDAAVYAELGPVRPTFVVAGVTAQNSRRVAGVHAVAVRTVIAQLDAAFEQARPAAIRIGLMPSKTVALAVARRLRLARGSVPTVLDPVIAASSGVRLVHRDALDGVRALARISTIITPNAHEAAELTGIAVRTIDDAERAARALSARHGCAALVTGGHIASGKRVVDVLARGERIDRFSTKRLPYEVRGTGCMLATAMAVSLARGATLENAVRTSRRFVHDAMRASMPLGNGRRQFAGAGVRPRTV